MHVTTAGKPFKKLMGRKIIYIYLCVYIFAYLPAQSWLRTGANKSWHGACINEAYGYIIPYPSTSRSLSLFRLIYRELFSFFLPGAEREILRRQRKWGNKWLQVPGRSSSSDLSQRMRPIRGRRSETSKEDTNKTARSIISQPRGRSHTAPLTPIRGRGRHTQLPGPLATETRASMDSCSEENYNNCISENL